MCYSALENNKEALECYRMAVFYDDTDAWFWHNYGDALYVAKRLPEAKQAFQRALRLNPKHASARAKLKKIDKELDEE
jgi:tetratricopeptide (TPR) repeat protein